MNIGNLPSQRLNKNDAKIQENRVVENSIVCLSGVKNQIANE